MLKLCEPRVESVIYCLAKVIRIEDQMSLDLGFAFNRVGAAVDPCDRLFRRRYLLDPEASH